jgi:hypothetical protein
MIVNKTSKQHKSVFLCERGFFALACLSKGISFGRKAKLECNRTIGPSPDGFGKSPIVEGGIGSGSRIGGPIAISLMLDI